MVTPNSKEGLLPVLVRGSSTLLRKRFRELFWRVTLTGLLLLQARGINSQPQDSVVSVGAGSCTTVLPTGRKEPQTEIYKTANVPGPVPTNDWWSSLAWTRYSDNQYPHPLAVKAVPAGLRIYYPGPAIIVNRVGIMGDMSGNNQDFTLGHDAQAEFPDARLDSYSDWFVTASFASGPNSLKVSYGHGSPFVYALYAGGNPQLAFERAPEVWARDAGAAVLGITINGKHYGLFGPTGATWTGLGTPTLTCQTQGKPYFSLALLPDKTADTLALFRRYAYAHVVDTKVAWSYEPKGSQVSTRYSFTTKPYEGTETETLFALYPHQWMHVAAPPLTPTYQSVRGIMKLGRGNSFTTSMTFPGVLPALPVMLNRGNYDKATLQQLVNNEVRGDGPPVKDTYWEGKYLGRTATLVPLAEQCGDAAIAQTLRTRLKQRLQYWFTAANEPGQIKPGGVFYYNRNWGTLIGYPASYGSDTDLSDHHFHYGYFLQAAAEIARRDPAWASDKQWGGMVRLLVRDVASPDRNDKLFPFLRNFDPYAGHSWASGTARFGSGNNQESSSEAMNAWTGLILLGEAIGDASLRDLGIYLYTTEMEAINNYWFDVESHNRPATYTPSVVTMVWGGKSVNETWFTRNPEAVHAINWLPFHGGSLYLGLYPDYVRRNYEALVQENGGENWDEWGDLVLTYRALHDPDDAIRQFKARDATLPMEAGNSRANLYHWLYALQVLGQVDRTTTADYPLHAVFKKDARKTYVVYNATTTSRTVAFSDGLKLQANPGAFTMQEKAAR